MYYMSWSTNTKGIYSLAISFMNTLFHLVRIFFSILSIINLAVTPDWCSFNWLSMTFIQGLQHACELQLVKECIGITYKCKNAFASYYTVRVQEKGGRGSKHQGRKTQSKIERLKERVTERGERTGEKERVKDGPLYFLMQIILPPAVAFRPDSSN